MIDVVACHSTSAAVHRMSEMLEFPAAEVQTDRTLLLVDDDEAFVKRLARAMEKRGFLPQTAQTVAAGLDIALSRAPPMRSLTFGWRMEAALMSSRNCGSVARTVASWC